MKDLRISFNLLDHPKKIKLQRRCGENSFENLLRLWIFVAQTKPKGILDGMSLEDVEIASRWDGEIGVFSKTLIEVGFLKLENDIYHINDWEEHNGYAFYSPQRSEKARNAANTRWYKHNKNKGIMLNDATSMLQASPSNAPSPPPSPSPSPSPSPKRTNKELSSFKKNEEQEEVFYLTKKNRELKGKHLETFMKFWDAFDYKSGKAEAADAWLDIPKLTQNIVNKIISAAKVEAQNRPAIRANGNNPKMGQGWLSGKRWEDEIIEKKTPSQILTKEDIDKLNE